MRRACDFMEPEAARELIEDGSEGVVEWCDGPGPVRVADDLDYILERAVDSRRAKRLTRKSKVPTVFVAEQWQRDDDGQVVVFVEGPHATLALGDVGVGADSCVRAIVVGQFSCTRDLGKKAVQELRRTAVVVPATTEGSTVTL